MSETKYYSVKEFSEKVELTQQALYVRINKDLAPFVKMIEGKKMISEEALEKFEKKENEQNSSVVLEKTLEIFQGQLTVKDEQIANLNKRLKEALELNKNNQILLKEAQLENSQLSGDKKEIETISDFETPEKDLNKNKENIEQTVENPKKGLFGGLKGLFKN